MQLSSVGEINIGSLAEKVQTPRLLLDQLLIFFFLHKQEGVPENQEEMFA